MGLMLSRTDAYEHQISTLTKQLQAAEKSIRDLQTSLDDLVQSKKEHEDMLLGGLAQVLNEKKLKIRNQQRLLASVNVDSEKGLSSSFLALHIEVSGTEIKKGAD